MKWQWLLISGHQRCERKHSGSCWVVGHVFHFFSRSPGHISNPSLCWQKLKHKATFFHICLQAFLRVNHKPDTKEHHQRKYLPSLCTLVGQNSVKQPRVASSGNSVLTETSTWHGINERRIYWNVLPCENFGSFPALMRWVTKEGA